MMRAVGTLVLAAACTSAPTADDAQLESPTPQVPDGDASPTIPDAVAAKRGKCVDAPFPEVKGPPDSGATMTMTPKARTFGAITCAGDREVWIDPQGRLDVCTIAKPTKVHGLALAGDNYTHFHPDGRPEQTTLAKPHTLQTAAGFDVVCAAEHVSLDEKGHVTHCTLEGKQTLGGTACRAGESAAFRPTGELWACTIDGSLALKGSTIVAGTQVSWHDNGAIASVYSPEPLVLDGIKMRYEVELHPDGTLARYTLDESRTVGGIALEAFAKVWFYEDGSPWHIEYVAKHGFMVHGEPWTDTRRITFDCAGKIVFDQTEHYQATARPRPPGGRER
jgi:hypothetical protein